MFYCKKCQEEQGWPDSFMKSHGQCEICDDIGLCNSVSSGNLPEPKTVRKPMLTKEKIVLILIFIAAAYCGYRMLYFGITHT